MNRGRLAAASSAVIALLVVAWLLLRGDEAGKPEGDRISATAAKNSESRRMKGKERGTPGVPIVGSGETGDIQRARIEVPEMAGDYPIHSRPYLASDPAFAQPNGYSLDRQAVSTGATEERSQDAQLFVVFVGNQHAVVGTDPFRSTLEVYAASEGGERLMLDGIQAEILELGADGHDTPVASARYVDDGSGGDDEADDRRYSHELRPSADGLGPGRYTIRVTFKADGRSAQARTTFVYTPGPQASGRFTGVFDEQVRDGDLVIGVVVELVSEGEFIIDGNLYPEQGLPIGRARYRGTLAKGPHVVELQFVGKMFTAANSPGPYLLRDLRGFRVDTQSPSGRQELYGGGLEFQTEAYALDRFSP